MRSRITWIGIVVALLGTSVVAYGVMIIVSMNDPSFAIEPNYEARAADWDTIQRQMTVNKRLGWRVAIRTEPGTTPESMAVTLVLTDRDETPIEGAVVRVTAFHNARAADILEFTPEHAGDGVYHAVAEIRRSGIWEFRVEADAGADHFTGKVRKSVVCPPRGGGRG